MRREERGGERKGGEGERGRGRRQGKKDEREEGKQKKEEGEGRGGEEGLISISDDRTRRDSQKTERRFTCPNHKATKRIRPVQRKS
jgi:hypothetical protein